MPSDGRRRLRGQDAEAGSKWMSRVDRLGKPLGAGAGHCKAVRGPLGVDRSGGSVVNWEPEGEGGVAPSPRSRLNVCH